MPRTFLLLFACLFATTAWAAEDLDPARIAAGAGELLAIPDRSQGSPGAERAVELIETRLRACGLVPVRTRTTISAAVDAGSVLEIAGVQPTRITLTPHRPNRAATAGTSGRRLSGTLLFAGKGRSQDLVGKAIAGAIVVLDGDSGAAWTQVAQLGAQAVIFRYAARIDRMQVTLQGVGVSLDFPRFVAELDPALDGATVALTSTVRFEPRTAWTVCARIAGTGNHREAVLLAAGYESPEAIQGWCPGATRAWNAGLLLETARSLAAEPPVRDVIVAFHGGRSELMRGLRHLSAALTLDRDADGFKADGHLVSLGNEAALQHWRETAMAKAFAAAAAEAQTPTIARLVELTTQGLTKAPVANVDPAIEASVAKRRVEDFIALQSGMRADALLVPLDLKRERIAVRSGMSQADRDAIARLLPTLGPDIEADKVIYQRYRTVQQKLAHAKDLDDQEAPIVRELVQAAQPNLERHLAIIARYRDDWASLIQARELLAGATLIHLIGFDLADGNDRYSSAAKGVMQSWESELGWLHSALGKLADDLNKQAGHVRIPFERAAHDSQDEVDAWFGGDNYLHEAGIAGLYVSAATISTVNDARLKVGSPADTAAAFIQDRFLAQVAGLRRFITGYIDGAFLANRKSKSLPSANPRIEAEVRSIGSKTGNRGYSYPLVFALRHTPSLVGDVRGEETWWGDAFGMCRVAFVPERHPTLLHLQLQVYGFDAQGGIVAVLADAGQQKSKELVIFNDQATDQLPLLFECVPSRLFDVFDPRLLSPLEKVTVLSATREAAPNYFHVESNRELALSAVFTEASARLRLTATQGQVGNRLVITGHAAAVRAGITDAKLQAKRGLQHGNLSTDTALDGAEDAWHLNEERLAKLRKTGINPESLITLHSAAQSHLEQARAAQTARDWPAARGHAQTAWALSGRVYPSVLGTANDVVYGLVVMLLFSIPFAWVCERLFLAGNTVMRKVVGFAVFFVATFLFFYFFHPAFALATTPMIIFLAFIIILMSTWVIGLVYSRFEHEMAQIRMAGMGMHTADVSRLGTLFATVALGISNMRRRPMRTTLTAATVVLMTFILLTFASFNASVGAQRIGVDAAPPYSGILVRLNGWAELPEQTMPRLANRWAKDFSLHGVRWLAPSAKTPKYPLTGPAGPSDVGGVVGVDFDDPTGIEQALIRGPVGGDAPRGFGGEGDWLFLPVEVIARLGVAPGAALTLRGVPVRIGSIDQARLGQLSQLGGDPLTPLSYDAGDKTRPDESARLVQLVGDQPPAAESSTAIHLSPTAVGIAHIDVVERLGGRLRAVALVPRDRATDIGDTAEEIARELACTLRVGESGESYLLTSVGRLSVAGLGAVLIPLILGGMIIFSTMLNSVAERGKEIFIYASLGLAPIHVAALFLVEAGIYAVLGGLGGYMLAQVIISALGVAASFGWGVQPDLNYSSFTAVITILLVMATVLLSALYPALVASKAANPGTTDFKLPDPQGDRLEIAFPFTVAARDVRGLCAFLAKYFDAHNEAAAGSFTAAGSGMQAEGDGFAVTAKVWLAPFDLGISQRFAMRAVPTDVRAIFAVQLTLDLLSGQRAAWKRTNLAFLKDLRQQFLVWRTLSPDTMDFYRAEGGDPLARERLAARAAAPATTTPALEGAS